MNPPQTRIHRLLLRKLPKHFSKVLPENKVEATKNLWIVSINISTNVNYCTIRKGKWTSKFNYRHNIWSCGWSMVKRHHIYQPSASRIKKKTFGVSCSLLLTFEKDQGELLLIRWRTGYPQTTANVTKWFWWSAKERKNYCSQHMQNWDAFKLESMWCNQTLKMIVMADMVHKNDVLF